MQFNVIKCLLHGLMLLMLVLSSACSTIEYYRQAISGHMLILQQQKPVHDLIEDQRLARDVHAKLVTSQDLIKFAHDVLLLPDTGSYRKYADIKRDYVVWNVIAVPELTIEPKTWCYALIACLPYRGYYNKTDAQMFGSKLEASGFDVYIGGVNAYSTLGWLKDPILNTMLKRDEIYLAELIFHELTHQKYYLHDDSEFNEALADTIARIGVLLWLENDIHALNNYKRRIEYKDTVFAEILEHRQWLGSLFETQQPELLKRLNKQQIYKNLSDRIETINNEFPDHALFNNEFWSDHNNAKLSIISTYHRWVPALMNLYRSGNNQISPFYECIEILITMKREKRNLLLNAMELTESKTSCI